MNASPAEPIVAPPACRLGTARPSTGSRMGLTCVVPYRVSTFTAVELRRKGER